MEDMFYNVITDNIISGDNDMRTRQQDRYDATINEIQQIAWELMAEHGPADLSLREISRRMRMSSGAIYRYFPNRNALLEQLSLDAYLSQDQALEDELAKQDSDDWLERIAAIAVAYRRWALVNPIKYLLVYGSPVPGYLPDWEHLLPAARRPLDGYIELIDKAEQQYLFTDGVTNLAQPVLNTQLRQLIDGRGYTISENGLSIALAGWAMMHGLVSLELNGQLVLLGSAVEAFFMLEVERFIQSIRS
jgi:AcrR family transcriptional regulator